MTYFILGFITFPLALLALSRHDRKRINKHKDHNGAVKKQGAHL